MGVHTHILFEDEYRKIAPSLITEVSSDDPGDMASYSIVILALPYFSNFSSASYTILLLHYFRSGSIIVDYLVFFKPNANVTQNGATLSQMLSDELTKNGSMLGKYPVTPSSSQHFGNFYIISHTYSFQVPLRLLIRDCEGVKDRFVIDA